MIETTILSYLVNDEDYGRKVLPFLKDEYFHDYAEKKTFKLVKDYIEKYNAFPTKEALYIDLHESKDLNEETYKNVQKVINGLQVDTATSKDWLLQKTEQFCKDKAVHNALLQSIKILDDKSKFDYGSITSLFQDAIAVSFDKNIGHDFLEDWSKRFEYYNRVEEKVPTNITLLDTVMNGGPPRKTFNMIIAPTGVGKSLIMCHMAADNLVAGKNVLYITLEMSEEKIAERIDANLLDIPVTEMSFLENESYKNRINKIKEKTPGKLIIKEYPTASAGAGNFRHLLNELRLKKNFVPDVIYIDYVNLCISSRIKMGVTNSYGYIKAISEEIRGLAVEFNTVIWSATQTNRGGFQNSDFDMDSTSESFGLPMTVDFMVGVITNEELQELGQYLFKQLKNRYGDPNKNRKFIVGVDYAKMRLYNVEESAQSEIVQDIPLMDKTDFGMADKFDHSKYKDWK